MNKLFKKNTTSIFFLLCMSVILSLIVNFSIVIFQNFSSENEVDLFPSEKYTMEIKSYVYDGNGNFFVSSEDPQLIFNNINSQIGRAVLKLGKPAENDLRVQIFYTTDSSGYSENNSFIDFIPAGSNKIEFDLKGIKCNSIRIDIDGDFSLEELWIKKISYLKIENFLLLEFFFVFSITVYAIWNKIPQKNDKLSKGELIFWIACCGYFFLWSCTKPLNYAPDEYMRYEVSSFIFENNRLPVGEETISSLWGFSYAQMPTMLCNFLGYIPMKLVSLFTSNEYAIVVASRFGSVVCGSICLLFIIKISKLMIKKPFHWVMIVFIALMPQYCFLCSYINNDICALCGGVLILYSWVHIMKGNWNYSVSVIMAVGIGICGISYYNSYGWVLMTIIMFLCYFAKNKKTRKDLIKHGMLIAGITIVIMAYPFIRQYVVYGDLLGFKTTAEYGELYAIESLKPSVRRAATIHAQGISLWDMLFKLEWAKTVYKSFIGTFGYMEYYVYPVITRGYFVLLCGGALALVYKFIKNVKKITGDAIKRNYKQIIFFCCLIGSMAIPVFLSVIYSYENDYQAQGRYIYSMMPGLALLFGISYEELLSKFKSARLQKVATFTLCAIMATFNCLAFIGTYLPS